MTLLEYLYENSISTESGCLLWLGGTSHGYGRTKRINGERYFVHRLAYAIYHRKNYYALNFIMHKCDVKYCFAFEHLIEGNHFQNIMDMIQKDRFFHAVGEKNGSAKLKYSQVREIKSYLETNTLSQEQIAKKFNVSQATISRINIGTHWKDL